MPSERAIAYSATTVLPADVCADTKTDWLFSMHKIASFWNGSKTNGYSLAGGKVDTSNGSYGWPVYEKIWKFSILSSQKKFVLQCF